MECPECGAEMELDDDGEWYCPYCDRTFWWNPFKSLFEDDDYVDPGPDKEQPDEMEWSDL